MSTSDSTSDPGQVADPIEAPAAAPDKEATVPSAPENADTDPAPESGDRAKAPETDELDIDALCAEANQLADDHEQGKADELKALLQDRDAAVLKLKTARRTEDSRLQTLENVKNPYDGLIVKNGLPKHLRNKLGLLGLVDSELLGKFDKISAAMGKLDKVKNKPDHILAKYEALREARAKLAAGLEKSIEEKRDAIEERRESVRAKIGANADNRVAAHRSKLDEINSNPAVEALNREFLKKVKGYLMHVEKLHQKAFAKLVQITGDEKIVEKLRDSFADKGFRLINSVGDRLVNAIKQGNLKRPSEIVPWKGSGFIPKKGAKPVFYFRIMDFLNADETHDFLCALNEKGMSLDADDLLFDKNLLGVLFGREKDRQDKRKSPFWRAFDGQKQSASDNGETNGNGKKRRRRRKKKKGGAPSEAASAPSSDNAPGNSAPAPATDNAAETSAPAPANEGEGAEE